MNKALIVGRISKDPVAAMTPSGIAVLNFSVETNEKWIDKDGSEKTKTQYHKCTAWGKMAEAYRDSLIKGELVSVEGSLYTSSTTLDTGRKDYRTEIKVQSIARLDQPQSRIPF